MRSSARRALRVAMIEPQCHGGVCHYSHALCNALVEQGVEVTLLTGARSELQDWPHRFPIANVLDSSQVKERLRRALGPFGASRGDAPGYIPSPLRGGERAPEGRETIAGGCTPVPAARTGGRVPARAKLGEGD